MSGVKLAELEASEMVDVIHYLFEEDNNHASGEQAEARSKTRTKLYKELYGTTYKYAYKNSSDGRSYIDESVVDEPLVQEDLPKPFDPRANAPKPFVPATKINPDAADPFGGILDAPIR